MFDSIMTQFKKLNRKIIPVLVYAPEALAEGSAGASAVVRRACGNAWLVAREGQSQGLWIRCNWYLI